MGSLSEMLGSSGRAELYRTGPSYRRMCPCPHRGALLAGHHLGRLEKVCRQFVLELPEVGFSLSWETYSTGPAQR